MVDFKIISPLIATQIKFELLYNGENYEIELKTNYIYIRKHNLAFYSNDCDISNYDENFNFVYNNLLYFIKQNNILNNEIISGVNIKDLNFMELLNESQINFKNNFINKINK